MWHAVEDKSLLILLEIEHMVWCTGATRQLHLHVIAVLIDQAHAHRDMERLLVGLPRCCRRVLLQLQGVAAGCRIVILEHGHFGCACLRIPVAELAQVDTVGLLHRPEKLLGGNCPAVIGFKIKIHTLAKSVNAGERVNHADHFRTLVINGDGVEIVDLEIRRRLDRVRHRSRIFCELAGAQDIDVIDALGCGGIHVSGKLLIAKYRQPFF